MKYDVVIIGSGMGGLVCGNILAKEGIACVHSWKKISRQAAACKLFVEG